MLLAILAALLVLVTAVAVILALRVEGFGLNFRFTKKEAPAEREKLPEGREQKYLR